MSPAALFTPRSGQARPPPGFRPTKDREDRSLGEASVYPGCCPWRGASARVSRREEHGRLQGLIWAFVYDLTFYRARAESPHRKHEHGSLLGGRGQGRDARTPVKAATPAAGALPHLNVLFPTSQVSREAHRHRLRSTWLTLDGDHHWASPATTHPGSRRASPHPRSAEPQTQGQGRSP